MKDDAQILDWLERNHTLHRQVIALYVVDGYQVRIEHDCNEIAGPFFGKTLREAYNEAASHFDMTPGNMKLAERAKFLLVQAHVRYKEDSQLNNMDDAAGNMPFMAGDIWKPVIDLANGVIVDWPQGVTAKIHYKVCDEGEYWLLNQNKQKIAKFHSDYVPDAFLCHGDQGYCDYIIMNIDGSGKIQNYSVPEVDSEEWIEF